MLRPNCRTEIPELTKLVVQAAFPNDSIFRTIRDEPGPVFEDKAFTDLYLSLDQPAESPARLALVTVMQHTENLTDRQVANAVRGRIDWKYALGLELSDPGFHYLVLNEVAREALEWLQDKLQPERVKRYGRRFDSYRLPRTQEKRQALAETIGRDGLALLAAIYDEPAPLAVRELAIVEHMRRIWIQHYYCVEEEVYWRTKKNWGQPPAGRMIASVDDPDARYCVKRSTGWTSYKVHLTEPCVAEHPRLITQVETTASTIHDVKVTEVIQENLSARGLKPETQLVDMGYVEPNLVVSSQQKGIDLVGLVLNSKSWQDRDEDAYDYTQFHIDWEQRVATCPGGKTSRHCSDRTTWRGTLNLLFCFSIDDCGPYPLRQRCTRARNVGRTLTVYPQKEYETLQQARQRQDTEEFKELYAVRAGIEGTIS